MCDCNCNDKVDIYDVETHLSKSDTICNFLDSISNNIRSAEEYRDALYKIIHALPNCTVMLTNPNDQADTIVEYIKDLENK